MIYEINPVAKPRMTRRDKWAQRPAVMRYRMFCDHFRLVVRTLPETFHVTFHLPMPASWSQKKRDSLRGKPHQQKPDVDNLLKAVADAAMKDDSGIWDVRATKVWSDSGKIEIKEI